MTKEQADAAAKIYNGKVTMAIYPPEYEFKQEDPLLREKEVKALYQSLLGRVPNDVSALAAGGMSLDEIKASLMKSDEYKARVANVTTTPQATQVETAIPQGTQAGTTAVTSQNNVITPVKDGATTVGEVVNGTYYQATQSATPTWMTEAYNTIGRTTVDAGGAAYWAAQAQACGGTPTCIQSVQSAISAAAAGAAK